MSMNHIRQSGFTIVELLVVISTLAILATISFMSYSSSITDARDSARTADIGNLKVALRSEYQKRGAYPSPGNAFGLMNSGVTNSGIVSQGFIDHTVNISAVQTPPKDPKTASWYGYATTRNRQAYELAATLENAGSLKAYIDGNYKTVAKNILPSLFLAMTGTTGTQVEIQSGVADGTTNRLKFVVNNGTSNLLYNMSGVPVSTAPDYSSILSQAGTDLPMNTSYANCQSIYEAGWSVGPGEYQVSDDAGAITDTGCLMNPPTY